MDEAITTTILECRKIIQQHRDTLKNNTLNQEEHLALVETTMKALNNYGFNSLQEFSAYNDAMNYAAYAECRPVSGSCDGCEGYKGTPPCQLKFNSKSCYSTQGRSTETVQKTFFFLYITNDDDPKELTKERKKTMCPEGHGYYLDLNSIKELPFDVKWRVF